MKLINWTIGLDANTHENMAVETNTANITAVLFTAPSKVILSLESFDLILKAVDLIAGFPDLPKVFKAEWLDIINFSLKGIYITYGLYNKFKDILKIFNPFIN